MNEEYGRILLGWMALGIVILPIVAVKIQVLKTGQPPLKALWELYVTDSYELATKSCDELPSRIATPLGIVVTVIAVVVCYILWLPVVAVLIYDYNHPNEKKSERSPGDSR